MLAFARGFAHLHLTIAGFPLFVTEGFLLVWVVSRLANIAEVIRALPRSLLVTLSLYLVLGCVVLIASLRSRGDAYAVIHDFALFYYGVFLLVGADLLRSPSWTKRLIQIVSLSSFVIVALGLANLFLGRAIEVTTSGTPRALTIAQGLYLIMGIVASTSALALRWKPRLVYATAAAVGVVGLVFSQSRSILLVLPIVVLIYLVVQRPPRTRLISIVLISVSIATLLAIVAVLSDTAGVGRGYVSRRFESFFHLSTDPNASFRLHSWLVALGITGQHPLTGVGFGHLSLLPDSVAPHNSMLTIAFESGLLGLLSFLAVNVAFYRFCINSLAALSDQRIRTLLATAVTWQVGVLGIALFNVALEGPFIGMFYWLSMGLAAASVWQKRAASQARGVG